MHRAVTQGKGDGPYEALDSMKQILKSDLKDWRAHEMQSRTAVLETIGTGQEIVKRINAVSSAINNHAYDTLVKASAGIGATAVQNVTLTHKSSFEQGLEELVETSEVDKKLQLAAMKIVNSKEAKTVPDSVVILVHSFDGLILNSFITVSAAAQVANVVRRERGLGGGKI